MRPFSTWIRPFAFAIALAAFAVAGAQDKEAEAARTQVTALFNVFKNRDWKTLFYITEFSPKAKATLTDADSFAKDVAKGIKDGDPQDAAGKLFDGMSDMLVGKAIIEGNFAYVSTACKVKINDQTVAFLGIAKMVKAGGTWKWDLTFTDDVKAATQQRFLELLGTAVGH